MQLGVLLLSLVRPARLAALAGACCLALVGGAEGQTPGAPPNRAAGQGAFPDAAFEASFEKYTRPSNAFSPFYSWDAHIAMNLTVARKGPGAVTFGSVLQSVGTESFGSRAGVGGTGYLLNIGYVQTYSPDLAFSAKIAHLSSHLTRDLDEKLEDERELGATIPTVSDPDEYNVLLLGAYRKLAGRRFTPEFQILVQPVSFRFSGRRRPFVRPVYLASRWTLWRGNRKSVVAETEHEIGDNAFNHVTLILDLFPRDRPEGRFQIFLGASPGHGFHVSPIVGGLRDGVALGMRVRFRD